MLVLSVVQALVGRYFPWQQSQIVSDCQTNGVSKQQGCSLSLSLACAARRVAEALLPMLGGRPSAGGAFTARPSEFTHVLLTSWPIL